METNQQLTTQQDNMSIADLQSLSKTFFESGLFSDVKSAQQAFVKILAGKEVGLPPFQSLSGIHIIAGKPVIGAGLIASRIKGSGKYDYEVVEMTEKNCSLDFYQGKKKLGNSSFNEADAKRAATKNMEKHPKNMLFARAISNGVKWFCPDVFGGPVYVPEEQHELKTETIDTDFTDIDAETEQKAFDVLNQSTTLAELQTNWSSLSKDDKKITSVLELKETLKSKLSV